MRVRKLLPVLLSLTVVLCALHTGMRRGELLALEWPAVDLHTKVITVKHSKSGKVRHVPLNDLAWNYLHALPGNHERGAVFTYSGHVISDIKTAFNATVRRAGIGRCGGDLALFRSRSCAG